MGSRDDWARGAQDYLCMARAWQSYGLGVASPNKQCSSIRVLALRSNMAATESFQFGQSIRALLWDLTNLSGEEITIERIDGYLWRLETAHHQLIAMDIFGLLQPPGPGVKVLECVAQAHR